MHEHPTLRLVGGLFTGISMKTRQLGGPSSLGCGEGSGFVVCSWVQGLQFRSYRNHASYIRLSRRPRKAIRILRENGIGAESAADPRGLDAVVAEAIGQSGSFGRQL